MPVKVLFVFGTRPEAIKLAPVIAELVRDPDHFSVRICVTGQHREMLAQVLGAFDLVPDIDLDLMRPNQELSAVAAGILLKLPATMAETKPDLVVVQGDTTTAMAAALASFYAGVEVAHVEAGLRSGNELAPWPEEVNRRLIGVMARFHFAPTDGARANLLNEGIDPARVFVTGNTVVDALQQTLARIRGDAALRERLEGELDFLGNGRRLILVTGHRRESFGPAMQSICNALADLVREHDDIEIVYPVHLNPNVQAPVREILSGLERVHLIEPVGYFSFIHLMMRSDFILTDSGGVQEEAPPLGKAVLVMRDTTERPEGVSAGNVRIIGTRREDIVTESSRLLRDPSHREAMSQLRSPFGDGLAAGRIADVLRQSLAQS
jgi:UDP-N-acetylglucosamine 2-epimerase (non-hydrolysing)